MKQAKVIMPRMGSSVHEGTVVQWLKEEGDSLSKGDPILLAESEKVEFEVESPYSGRLAKLLVSPEETVPVGEAVALVETEDDILEETEPKSKFGPVEQVEGASGDAPIAARKRETRAGFLSPRVRKLAGEHGLPPEELTSIQGTGKNGRVTEGDLLAYLSTRSEGDGTTEAVEKVAVPVPAAEEADVLPLSLLRKRLVKRLTESVREVPQFTTFDEADVTEIVRQREALGETLFARNGIHLTYTHFIAWAALRALEEIEFVSVNARFAGDVIYRFKTIHLGMAVAVPDGLIVPVIRSAEELVFADLALQIQDMADRARQGTLEPGSVLGSTFTITNPGAAGSFFATPILNPPEAAILGVGTIRKCAVPLDDGSVGVRDRMGLFLTVDHRVVDGVVAARFNRTICENLEGFDFSVLDEPRADFQT